MLWLLPATLLAGLLASAATYWGALSELDEVLGDQLKGIGQHVVVDENNRVSLTGLRQRDDDRMSGEQSHGVLLQIWRGATQIFSSDPDSILPPPVGTGLADITVGGQLWHSFVTREGDVSVRVAQQRKARWEAVAEIAMHLFWPVLSLVPVLALFLWFGIGYGLRPLREIAASLKRRDANNMQPIYTAAMPGEVKPLVDALNDLLHRLDNAFTAQKNFIADAAHELRTPIMGLGLQAELLERASSAAEREEINAQLRVGVVRLARLSEQLLTLARLSPDAQLAEDQPFDLCALARSVVSDRSRVAEVNDVDLGLVEGTPLIVRGNAENVRILLNNLVDNAIRYGGSHSRVDVVVHSHEGRPVVEVRDTGPGIAEVDLPRVWERFYRGSGHAASGSGLGLSIARRIAEQHHAVISLERGLDGRGLTVRVCFPGAPADLAYAATAH
ncbi:ATP-binding protein [Caballeronia concitans]|uniref:ATP-binding protein n=1 Tax=Caballeronia concitans TaxID=1777133 RepID=UPI000B351FCD|nr:ATP-binding protein [Caballeronia concitans]